MPLRRGKKSDREHRVLIGLIDLFLATGKAVGSNTLREHGFDDLSSATIRNYCARLEQEGYLSQAHTSGGRVPTPLGYQLYADEFASNAQCDPESEQKLSLLRHETKEIASYLEQASEALSEATGYAVFLSSPRFDHDLVLDVKLVGLDQRRILCVMLTDFGSVLTEVLHVDKKISSFVLKRLEAYFSWRITGLEMSEPLDDEDKVLGQRLYNEVMARYITHYSSFSRKDLFRTGFSRLLAYTEFKSAAALANGLAVFENRERMHRMLQECEEKDGLHYWIGNQLAPYIPSAAHCSVVGIPYYVNGAPVGAVAVLGPTRLAYRKVFGILGYFSETISDALSKSLYKFRIQYRQPSAGTLYLPKADQRLLEQGPQSLIEGGTD